VVSGPAEPHIVRTDLGIAAGSGRAASRTAVLTFAQISDVHIVDTQSPMRVEYLDRFEDTYESGDPTLSLLQSSHRAHETLTAQVADSMVRAINQVGAGPVMGKPIALTVQTGDNSDNSQYNEVRWNIDLLDGKTVRPDSGDLTKYEGVQDSNPTYYDTHYWHPDAPPLGKPADIPKQRFGFPTIPGLLAAARKPFQAQGLSMPWVSAFGNHDGLVQGNFPSKSLVALNLVATGNLKLISPPPGMSQADLVNALKTGSYMTLLLSLVLSPYVRTVTPDPNRRLLSKKQVVEEHFASPTLPYGHGFSAENRSKGTAYYTFDQGAVRFIVLDTVNPNGYSDGSIDQTQFTWLKSTLAASKDKLCILASHHTIATMTNPLVLTGLDLEQRVLGSDVLPVLLDNPQVIAWVNGHTHRNEIFAHARPDGSGGFWEINTASHIDWPQQARVIEVVDNADGTLSLFATVVNHAAPARFDGNLADPQSLAALARELSANDPQYRTVDQSGAITDRNVELVVQNPL
jgi:metallophosphoesterase (TIGR03767 family)